VARHRLAVVVLSLALPACGGGRTHTPPLTGQAFRTEANRICARTHSHAARLASLRRLHPPAADQDLYAHWLKAERDAITATKPPKGEPTKPVFDERTPLTIAEGKIAGYARRLGATRCE
jgi:hypothetical protein